MKDSNGEQKKDRGGEKERRREGEADIDRESESEKQAESVCERVQTEREKKKERCHRRVNSDQNNDSAKK